MKKMKLLMMLGMCSVLGLGTAVAISCTTKQNVKASEIVEDSEAADEEEENSRGLTDYFNKTKIKDCDIQLESDSFDWSGQVITPKVTVTYNGTTLTINKDYTLKYTDNVDAGMGFVKVKGIGDYRGSRKIEFRIKGIDIGKECTYEFVNDRVVMYYNGEVVDEKDYDVESYYFDTFVKDDGLFTTYVRTTTYTLFGKGRFEGEYELPTEKTYKVNNETGEEIFE